MKDLDPVSRVLVVSTLTVCALGACKQWVDSYYGDDE